MKIAFITSEIAPFSKTGGLADVSSSLAVALEKLGFDILVITPKYRGCSENDACIGGNIKVHFIKKDEFFDRDSLYGDAAGDYKDNLDRFSYFSRLTLEYLKETNFNADIIHCNDWQSSLVPLYLSILYKNKGLFKETHSLLTIHNIAYQGIFDSSQYGKIGIGKEYFNMECLEFYGKINLLKGGIVFSDLISTVSPAYVKEMQMPQFGHGLDGVVRRCKGKIFGVLSGVDYNIWDPKIDNNIKKNYSNETIENKYMNKEDLQQICGFEVNREIPLLGIISRLTERKGIDMIIDTLNDILKEGAQFILLGIGEAKYHKALEDISAKSLKGVSLNLRFDPILAHKIYAGCDTFLIPSRYEPCGVGQMISLKYGTIPIVHETGGLGYTVKEFDPNNLEGNGFVFSAYDKKEFLGAIKRAINIYRKKELWRRLVAKAMNYNFSWENPALEYANLYGRFEK